MTAALLTQHNAPLVLADVEPCELAPGQVLVNMLVSGICGKQTGEIRGDYDAKAPLPRILGHEGCGVVEQVGPGVTKVKKGDKVVCHWRKGSGMDAEFPRYAVRIPAGCFPHDFTTGKIATFAEQTIISENRVTAVPYETPNELCCLLGCGLSTALGVMENDARLRAGESVLIVGCGGVGLNLIRVANMMGAEVVFVRDIGDNSKAAFAVGATSFTHPTKDDIRRSMDSMGPERRDWFDVIVDTTGNVGAIADALPLLGPSGRFIMVGQPKLERPLTISNASHLFEGEGKRIIASQGGGFNPDSDIPRYVAMHRSGHLKIDGLITHRYPLAQINEALDVMRSGSAGRVMIEMI